MKTRLLEFSIPIAVALVAGLAVMGALVSVPGADWESLGLSALTSLRTVKTDCGGVIITTNYHPLIVGLPAALAALGLAGIGLTLSGKATSSVNGSSAGAFTAGAAKIGAGLSDELSKVLSLLRSHLGSSENYEQSLSNAQSRLAAIEEPKQVRVVVKLLLAENERMRLDTADLKSKLEQARTQVENLRTSLNEAQEMGLQDALTSVGNRRCFDETLAKEIETAKGSGVPLSLVICDIDNFKAVNDTHGHGVGDEVLKMFARFLADSVRDTDTVARFGGEEFGLILPHTPGESALALAERIRSQCETRRVMVRTTNQKIGSITASFGVAELKDGENLDKLIERADARLYEAKCNGRNKVAG